MLEWIKTWTFFNWLALIAFLFACISVLNAFLSLRSRWKDWRGVQSKKAYEKRLLELNEFVERIGKYRREPATYFFELAYMLYRILGCYIIASSLFALVLYNFIRKVESPTTLWFSVGGLLILSFSMGLLSGILRLVKNTAYPSLLTVEVYKFMTRGGKKKWLTMESAIAMLDTLYRNNFITEIEHTGLTAPGNLKKLIKS